MQEILIVALHQYLHDDYPELVRTLSQRRQLTQYLIDKVQTIDPLMTELLDAELPSYQIHEQCMHALVENYGRSRFRFICTVMENEFEDYYLQLSRFNLLKDIAINIIDQCKDMFDQYSDEQDEAGNRLLYYLITDTISQIRQLPAPPNDAAAQPGNNGIQSP